MALTALLVLVLIGCIASRFGAGPRSLTTDLAQAPLIGAECPSRHLPATAVTVTVAPELQRTVIEALAPLTAETLPDRTCVQATVQVQEPAQTVDSAQILPVDRAPDIWVPDSSLWLSRVPRWPLKQTASFATSPVVIASSQATLNRLGWQRRAPSWPEAVAGKTPVAVPQLPASAPGMAAVITTWQSLKKGAAAQQALAGAVLAAGRAGIPTEAEALAAAESGSPNAPLLPTTEQAVAAANVASGTGQLVSVQPKGGSPTLDYPILTTRRSAAIQAVVDRLTSARSRELATIDGFEEPKPNAALEVAATTNGELAPAELGALVQRITALSAPSRFLVIFDLSGSMAAPAGNGMSRIQFAGTAAKFAGDLLTDRAQIGLWGFSRDLSGTKDIVDLVPVKDLGSRDGKISHRETMNRAMFATPEQLGGNGTALYKAAVAGMKRMKQLYDPRAGNAVVLFTDGANSDPGGPTLASTVTDLKKLYDPKRPVRLICVGLGDGVDMKEMGRLTGAVDGLAYRARTPQELPKVLLDVMNRRGS